MNGNVLTALLLFYLYLCTCKRNENTMRVEHAVSFLCDHSTRFNSSYVQFVTQCNKQNASVLYSQKKQELVLLNATYHEQSEAAANKAAYD